MKVLGGKEMKGIKISTFSFGMIFLTFIFFVFLIAATVVVSKQFEALSNHTQVFVKHEEMAKQVDDASDYLTEQVHLFVQMGDLEYARRYFMEANETKRRDTVLEELKGSYSGGKDDIFLEAAIARSNALMDQEIYAMRLVSDAMGYDASELPEEINQVTLQKGDANFTPEEKIERAKEMVFGEGYQKSKDLIEEYIALFVDGIQGNVSAQLNASRNGLTKATVLQVCFLILLLLMNILTFVMIILLVLRPLRIHQKCVEEQTLLLEDVGGYEFRYLARVYNEVYNSNERRAANEVVLRHRAEYDALTGVRNRGVFDQINLVLEGNKGPLALLLIDVDRFKEINDSYGHDIGDQVLKKVARTLEKSFYASDYLFRIGGDEFAAVLIGVERGHESALFRKVQRINQGLQNKEDGLPPVTVSVGAAFSDEGYHEELYHEADQALYWVKKNGRCGFWFYQGEGQLEA